MSARIDRLFIRLTNECNLRCAYCYTDSAHPLPSELSVDEWLSIIDVALKTGIRDFRITGGEPMLARAFWPIMAALHPGASKVVVTTNGHYLDLAAISRLRSWPAVRLWVSLHSLDYSKRNATVSLYEDPDFGNAALAAASGIGIGVSICATDTNFALVPHYVDQVLQSELQNLRVIFPSPLGRNREQHTGHFSAGDWNELGETISALARMWPEKVVLFEQQTWTGTATVPIRLASLACQIPTRPLVTIDADGETYPCTLLTRVPGWSIGNVRDGSLAQNLAAESFEESLRREGRRDPLFLGCPAYAASTGVDPRPLGEGEHYMCPLLYSSGGNLGVSPWKEFSREHN